jgi:hypothetical protein
MLKTKSFEFERGTFRFLERMTYDKYKLAESMCEEHAEENRLVGIKRWDWTRILSNG